MNPTQTKPTDGLAPGVPVTMTPVYRMLAETLTPKIEVFILQEYVKRSGGKLPTAARAEDLTAKAAKAMKAAIERAWDLKLTAKLVVPNVMLAIQELLERELGEEFGTKALAQPAPEGEVR